MNATLYKLLLTSLTMVSLLACGSKVEVDDQHGSASIGTANVQSSEAQNAQPVSFGAEPVIGTAALSLSEAIAKSTGDTPLRVKGLVQDVCQKKGCWMILSDRELEVRVTFKDYGFFVPLDLGGKTVVVEGTLTETVVSEADARHYAEDAGQSEAEIQQIIGDQKEYSLIATSVQIQA